MQTFLPYADFKKSAECLDYRRLGKQRLEAKQIIDLLEKHDAGEDISKLGWGNHPAVRMWIGHTYLLKAYYNEILDEWIRRGYKNNMKHYDIPISDDWLNPYAPYEQPPWRFRKDFHDAHKSKLLQKDYEYYKQFEWDVDLNLEYKWR